MDGPLLTFAAVVVDRAGRRLVGPLDLEIPAEGITVIAGPSGAGKTTLLRLCNHLEAPTSGIVRYRGQDVAASDVLRLRREVGMVFQVPVLFGGSVRDNLAVASPDATDQDYRDALRDAALAPDYLDRDAGSLSGGEAQRACLARTLATGPQALLLDEPTSALDDEPKRVFERTALALARRGLPIVWVTHESAQQQRIADRVVQIRDGRISHAQEDRGNDER